MIYAGTGHRPARLGLAYDSVSNKLLTGFVRVQLAKRGRAEKVISGMAPGYDQALAHAAVLLGLPLICAVPFEGQESRWPEAARRRYDAILAKAWQVVIVTPGGYSHGVYETRDRWMVEEADAVLSLWDGQRVGGTALTVAFAERAGKPVDNLWLAWQDHFRSWKERTCSPA